MNQLIGMKLLIGKEKEQGRLMVAAIVNGQMRTSLVGAPNSVPSSVSRCRPGEGVAHCSIEITADGTMLITNLKPQNITCIDGVQVASKCINEQSTVQLGVEKYPLPIASVLKAAHAMVGRVGGRTAPPVQEYSIRPLKEVYDRWKQDKKEISERNKKRQDFMRIPTILTTTAGILTTLSIAIPGVPIQFRFVCAGITFFGLVMIVQAFIGAKKDHSVDELERLNEQFQDDYVCPNPNCQQFMGFRRYKDLRKDKKCKHCGCRYTEE
ncbi:MAG: hypothetical protein HUK03_00275 [Bacteroidaceae bacterium]|nr:hypothetical protein [Bacteroidaceae bacterium]